MESFDEPAATPDPAREPAAPENPWHRPEGQLGAVTPAQLLLARTPSVAVAVTAITGYSSGFAFTVSVLLRHEDRPGEVLGSGLTAPRARPGVPPSPAVLRLGVEFSDGRVATNLDPYPFVGPQPAPTGPLLLPTGGIGTERWSDMHYWVWPLPPPGLLTFVCEWPIHGIALSRAEVDAALIRDAAMRAIALWPDDDPPQQ